METHIEKEQLLEDAIPLHKICAVYFLIRNDEVVYVGKTVNLLLRLASHISEGKKVFDSYNFIECQEEELNKIEAHYIWELKPKYNFSYPENDKYLKYGQVEKYLNADWSLIDLFIVENNLKLKRFKKRYKQSEFDGFQDWFKKYKERRLSIKQFDTTFLVDDRFFLNTDFKRLDFYETFYLDESYYKVTNISILDEKSQKVWITSITEKEYLISNNLYDTVFFLNGNLFIRERSKKITNGSKITLNGLDFDVEYVTTPNFSFQKVWLKESG